ncbi:hypothetical protein SAY87_017833 [Trapa incisa]|uniref:CG-1 domain-containing protein n=1 Tax=Trapa incisa TaxID=236973 RepID=A0AAN7QUN5_9MYRT|nr:hypothetical protein SAY87_017833 [Trapa incisa]
MAQRGSYGLSPQLGQLSLLISADIQQLQVEAQHRWLRPAEICEILRNYPKFQISTEPPNSPPSGSLFLFDRKVLRYFRKDGHNWRKKKDGKTVKEAHEKLKVGSVDVLHCYYAHGEENENFQRRSYWMLEQDQHIVFVHYLEVKGNRTNVDIIREHDDVSSSNHDSPLSHSFTANHSATPSGHTDSTSPTSTLTQLCEDADSGDIRLMSAGLNFMEPSQKLTSPKMDKVGVAALGTHRSYPSPVLPGNLENQQSYLGTGFTSNVNMNGPKSVVDGFSSQNSLGLASWEEILRQSMTGSNGLSSNTSISSNQSVITGSIGQDNFILGDLLEGDAAIKQPLGSSSSFQSNWQPAGEIGSLHTPGWSMDHSLDLDLGCDPHTGFLDQMKHTMDSHIRFDEPESFYGRPNQHQELHGLGNFLNAESSNILHPNLGRDVSIDGDASYSFTARRLLKDGEESLKKVDSFSRWVSKELEEVESLQMQSSTGLNWSTDECETGVDHSSLSPSISQDQLFSIIDISPKWAYTNSNIQVLIVGTFLKNQGEATQCNWSCMFGEVEVPAHVLGDGLLSCQAPVHSVGQVPFYVTCSNRLACSEVREFDYRAGSTCADIRHVYDVSVDERNFCTRLDQILSLKLVGYLDISHEDLLEKRKIINKIIALKEETETLQILEGTAECYLKNRNHETEKLLRTLMEEKLYSWLIHKVVEDGKGPCILDEQGQGVLHLVAALGCDWAVKPILAAGVSINFRDVNGWTALHWAACCGREQTVATLVDCSASTGLLSDPSPEFPLGRTPADLASVNGHKGISGFLAESSLTSYLQQLTLIETKEDATSEVVERKAFHTLSGLSATPFSDGDLSLKDSLTAVCNATQAADRIYQVFRVQSFQRKQLEFAGDMSELDGRALPLAAARNRTRLANSAAIQIQKKFRGWKKRKEFLNIRQRIVKIQAQWRGHQVRKQYRTIIWSVGILEKIILRWRRKGSGLRGYKSDTINKDMSQQVLPQKEDDYDFLKEGRKQTEERLQKALTRVKSMVQYPEARAQYRRLLTVCEGFREKKECGMILNRTEEAAEGDDDMIDIDCLLDDDSLMSMTFE